MPGVPGSAVNEMIEMALRKRWLLQGGFRYMRYGLPQPVTSVTGFAMTGGFTRGAVQRGVGDAAPYGCIIDGAVGWTEASIPTEVYLAVRRGGALLPTVVPTD